MTWNNAHNTLLAVHLVPIALRWVAGCVLGFLLLLGFHANRSTLNSTWLGPVSETYSISPAGSGLLLSGQRRRHLYNRQDRNHAQQTGRNAPEVIRP